MPARSVSPVSSIAEALDRWRAGDRVQVLRSEFLDVLAPVPDPRDPRGRPVPAGRCWRSRSWPLPRGCVAMPGSRPGPGTAPMEVLAQLGIRYRRPSEKTFRAVLSRLDPDDLDRRLGAYFTARATEAPSRAGARRPGRQDPAWRSAREAAAAHLVSVFAHRARLVLGQLAVAEKSNEIPCVRKLLKLLPRQVRWLVTVDAMHTQTATAKLICSTLKSHYLMIVKSNQAELLARITALPWADVPVRSPPTTPAATAAPNNARCKSHRRTRNRIPLRQTGHPNRESAWSPPPGNAPPRWSTRYAACPSSTPDPRRSRPGYASTGASRTPCTGCAT